MLKLEHQHIVLVATLDDLQGTLAPSATCTSVTPMQLHAPAVLSAICRSSFLTLKATKSI